MNNSFKIIETELLSDDYYTLNKVTYELLNANGVWETTSRESYDKGNGATILLYNTNTQNIILTKQLRIPTYLNGNKNGMLIEACAGGVENNEDPKDSIIRETEEETGYKIKNVQKIFDSYMSPGSVTEILYFFIAEYNSDMKISEGGGLLDEQENIEVLELNFHEAYEMISTGKIKDAKTIMFLQYAKINIF
ncbi:NUDIX domain-containing protein [Wenyingzhuangia sp. 2_MG-2023]|uniref:NUDIX domain-containing protein n=1 Tax=Wenyingzhuangia sp. 2_MG-2023 TaxID=3062639 RepID=UPI0026E1793D|nr:NUDIX domain-containing protein [Wenyingzhuangia sp. 2_MG-2023]MDO6738151.1 NUDIX domain-containing protein [Wenyingzhuangia sp. 2_MG-2023]MDO6801525.1 NUDIX domain-containing protein [Wenyingzhuangia sp. 1_MG-2023]